jgi:hypothetical protein
MIDDEDPRDLARLVGSLQATDDRWVPFRLLDSSGIPVEVVWDHFRELQAVKRSVATIRPTVWICWLLWAIEIRV